jgi:hypothetical protein
MSFEQIQFDTSLLVALVAVLVLAFVVCRRVGMGTLSHFPTAWTPTQRAALRGAQVAVGLVVAVAWIVSFHLINEIPGPLLDHGLPQPQFARRLIFPLALTLLLLLTLVNDWPRGRPSWIPWIVLIGVVGMALAVIGPVAERLMSP